ncbi:equilibrative nucleoside transporter 1-like [Hydractinia symbiolongicarpus]|uniref:equilibrative nucleoside transporter 1-like n=1 Tax=Hydractinia symbiolongicarpus TaxID=13093 RepID=UPI00254C252C|nr:equilibrative nucleoside transporter 1-like [Hydractinia symbiolongicarpus]XP_057301547.1 equilibrative nucleoside transporter 1-like [Hydractinia symbiolongicarpus]
MVNYEESNSDDDLLISNPEGAHIVQPHVDPDFSGMSNSVNAPSDRYNIIYIIFFIQGVGMLLPWNFFITAKDYFSQKFEEDANIQGKFENAFALSAMFPNVISLFLNIFLTNRLSRGVRVITCLLIMIATFTVTTVLVKVDSQSWPDKFFVITVCSVIIINISSGVYQGTLFGVAGIVGQRYIQAIMSGQAIAGIFAALADLISKLAENDDTTTSAFIYFLIAVVVIAITAVSYTMLFKMPRMQFYFRRFERRSKNDVKIQQEVKPEQPDIPYWQIFKEIWPMAFSVTVVFGVTLSMFPAVLVKIRSTDEANGSMWNKKLFATVVVFLIFNCGDWVGRIFAGQFQLVKEKGPWLPFLAITRVVFIPLFFLCNIEGSVHLPYVFKHDFWPVIINVFFSLTNGYLGSLCMMYGPKLVSIEYSETAGTIMSLFLSVGLTLGACVSFAL